MNETPKAVLSATSASGVARIVFRLLSAVRLVPVTFQAKSRKFLSERIMKPFPPDSEIEKRCVCCENETV